MHSVQWERLLDDAKSDALTQARVRERWLRRQATESATLVGTLVDLAESGAALSMTMLGGRRHDGVAVGVGHDVLVVLDRGEHIAIRIGALTLVRPSPGTHAEQAAGDRAAALDLGFVELLARIVDDRPDVAVALVTGEALAGSLLSVGSDLLTLRLAPGPDGVAYCSVDAVSSVRFRSG